MVNKSMVGAGFAREPYPNVCTIWFAAKGRSYG